MKPSPRRQDPWAVYHQQNRHLQQRTSIGYEAIRLLICVGFIAGLFAIYAQCLKGSV